jgi:hypothetical protein
LCEIVGGEMDFTHNPSENEKKEIKEMVWVPKEKFSLEKYYFGDMSENFTELVRNGLKL